MLLRKTRTSGSSSASVSRTGKAFRELKSRTRARLASNTLRRQRTPNQQTQTTSADGDRLKPIEYIGYALGDTASGFFFQTFNIFSPTITWTAAQSRQPTEHARRSRFLRDLGAMPELRGWIVLAH